MPARRVVPLASILLLPVLVHLPVLSPWLSADPILWWSGLAIDAPEAGQFVAGSPGWADGNAGVTTEALGGLAASDWLRGVVPWWNPYSGVGMPLAGEMQNSALFLPFVLLLRLPEGVFLLKIAMQMLTGLAMFGLLRALSVGLAAAWLGATLAEFNGTFAWYAHGPIMPVAFLPLLLLGIELCRNGVAAGRRWPAGPVCVVASAVAFSIYAGFPETAFLDGLFSAVFTLARVFSLPPASRARFAAAVSAGGLCGALLAAPAAVPFLDYLRHAYLSLHADFSRSRMLPGSGAMLLLPYLFGPILSNYFATGTGQDEWWCAGGYVSLPLAALAAAALPGGSRRLLSVRLAIAAWVLATVARAAGVGPAVRAFDAVPGLRHVLFPNYVEPSWEIGAAVLAALAVEDWRASPRARPVLALAVLGGLAAAGLPALWHARGEFARLWRHLPHDFAVAVLPSLLTTAACASVLVLIARPSTQRRRVLLFSVLGLETVGNFALPLLSATRAGRLDEGPVAFLRAHLGLRRFDSVSVFKPNYGALERLASVNHNALPVPQDWVDFLHAHLSPTMDGVMFHGATLLPAGGGEAGLAQVIAPPVSTAQAVRTLEGLGVAYVLTPHADDVWTQTGGTNVSLADLRPVSLMPGRSVSFALEVPPGSMLVEGGVVIGTYAGLSDGTLTVRVCDGAVCRQGARGVGRAADNATLAVPLAGGLPATSGRLDVTVGYAGGSHRVAIYDGPRRDGGGRLPVFTWRALMPSPPALVYADGLVDIYALPDPTPYEDASSGRCRLDVRNRTSATADCRQPDRLVRRELFFPGWRASVDGREVPIAREGALFQAVALPAGHSEVRFAYAPPFLGWALAMACLGLGGLLAGFAGPLRSRVRAAR